MGTNNTEAEAFARRLEHLAKQRGFLNQDGSMNKSRLGREVDPENPVRGRRRVLRHTSGKHLPSRASRDSYAEVLDVAPSELPLPSDDGSDASTEALVREARALARRVTNFASRLTAMDAA